MEKEFNKASRKLFSADCPISECKEGKPSNTYVELKVYESYFNLLDRFAEFKPQIDAITKRHKAWHSEFEIDGKKYTVKALDNKLAHNFTTNDTFSTVFLPEGYVKIESADNVEWKTFAELHEALRCDAEKLNKFDEAFVKAQKTDITSEYLSDLRIIFANTLSPIHAVAKDGEAFGQLLNVIGTYHQEINNFLQETYKSSIGLSQLLEHQAGITLEERDAKKLARPETLEDVLEMGIFEKVAAAIKKASISIPGLLVATASGAVATHSDSHDAVIYTNKDIGQKPYADNIWENLSAINAPKSSAAAFGGASYISSHNEILFLRLFAPNPSVETWVYNIDNNTWENKTTAQQVLTSYLTYDSKNDKVISLKHKSVHSIFETWIYDPQTNTWTNKTTGAEPTTPIASAYDKESGKIVGLPGYISGSNKTWIYDYLTNTWENKTSSTLPKSEFYDYYGIFYSPNERKVLCLGDQGLWKYDVANSNWIKKSEAPKFIPYLHNSDVRFYDCAYDEKNDKIVELIGKSGGSPPNNYFETWIYDIGKNNWSNPQPAAHPSVKNYGCVYSLVYDSKDEKILNILGSKPYPNGYTEPMEVWQYSVDMSGKPPAASPTLTISLDENLLFVTPEKITSPQAGDNSNVVDNLKNFESQKNLFTAPDGKPILFNKKVSTTGYDYDIFFLYWTDNPSNIPVLSHQHDWEYIVYKYDKAGNLLDTRLSNHLETRTAAAGAEIFVGQGGHEMTTNKSEMWNPIPNLPRHFKDGGQSFKPGDYYVVSLDSIIDSTATDSYSRYKADEPTYWSFGGPNEHFFDSLPADQKAIAKERAKVPWLQNIMLDPEQIFTKSAPKPVMAVFELEGKDADLEFKVTGGSVTGEDNGTIKSEIPQAGYTKVSPTKDVIALYTTEEQYDKYKVELRALNDSSYKIKASVESKGVLTVKEYSGTLKAGETYVLSIEPQPKSNPNNSMTWTLIGAGAAGAAVAAGVGYVLYNRRRRPPALTTVPQPAQPQQQQQAQYQIQYNP